MMPDFTSDMRLVGRRWLFEPRPLSDRQQTTMELPFYELVNRVRGVLESPPEHDPSPDALELAEAYFRSLESIRLVTSDLSRTTYHASTRFIALLDAMERGQHWKDRP